MAADRRARLLDQAADRAIDAMITAPPLPGVRTPVTQRRGLLARMNGLEKSHGGVKAAARAAGVTPRTWNAWKTGTRPARRSLTALDDAYKTDLSRRGNTRARRLKYARDSDTRLRWITRVTAEIQWDGYYNGQAEQGPSTRAHAPLPDNLQAHRRVDFGPLDVSTVVRTWGHGGNTGEPLETLLSAEYNADIFLNAYYHNPIVEFT